MRHVTLQCPSCDKENEVYEFEFRSAVYCHCGEKIGEPEEPDYDAMVKDG